MLKNKSFLEDLYEPSESRFGKNLVMLNFQPKYQDMFTFDLKSLGYYIKNFSNVLYMYEEETGYNNSYQIQSFLEDTCNIEESHFFKFETLEVNTGFLLDFLELNIKKSSISSLIQYMKKELKNIEDIKEDEYSKLSISKELSFLNFKEQNLQIPELYETFNYNKFVFIGGFEEDSMLEYQILFDSLHLKYDLNYNFIF